jgi:glycerol kinase
VIANHQIEFEQRTSSCRSFSAAETDGFRLLSYLPALSMTSLLPLFHLSRLPLPSLTSARPVSTRHPSSFPRQPLVVFRGPPLSFQLLRPVHPEPGWHEHDPAIYIREIDKCIESCLQQFEEKGHQKDELKGVGIATQRETTLLWDRTTGKPLHNASASQLPLLFFRLERKN